MITQSEWKKLGELIVSIIRGETKTIKKALQALTKNVGSLQKDMVSLKDQIKHLPSKEEYYDREDKHMKELQDMRDNVDVISAYKDDIEDHQVRINRIERRLDKLRVS
ncbi:hypothetical protein HY468_01630 [Candidatus Roizmanbacteria bacterium]|nr:hypothetical protein [Candidatus Roizmanbacteria bacterium]